MLGKYITMYGLHKGGGNVICVSYFIQRFVISDGDDKN